MKLKLKSLAVAAAMSAVAMTAQAEIVGGADSELFFSAYNADKSYTFDLPSLLTFNSWLGVDQAATTTGNATLLANLPTYAPGTVLFDVALTGFSSVFGSDLSGVQWNFGAFDNTGRKRLVTTQTGNLNLTNLNVSQAASAMNSYTAATNPFSLTQDLGVDEWATATNADGVAYAGAWTGTWNNTTPDTLNAMGATAQLGFYAMAAQAANQGNAAALYQDLGLNISTYQDQAGGWNLRIASAAAAVPEPESYAMMLAGLAMLGGVARRRNNKA